MHCGNTNGRSVFETRRFWVALLATLLTVASIGTVASPPPDAADQAGTAQQAPPGPKRDKARSTDPGTPVGAVRSFFEAAGRADYDAAARRLNLSEIPEADRAEIGRDLAWELEVVLERTLPIHYELLSKDPAGAPDDGLPPGLDRLGTVEGTAILLERVTEDDGAKTWKFAASTVERIPALYEAHGYGPLGEFLPAAMFDIKFLDLQLWQWIGMILLVLAAWLLSWVGAAIVLRIVRPLVSRTETALDDQILHSMIGPFRFLLAVGLFAAGSVALALSISAYDFLGRIEVALVVVAVTWVALRIVDILETVLVNRLSDTDRASVIAILPLTRKVAKVFLIVIAFVALLQNLGFNVTGLLAGLGVGGLAVALAAQKLIANLFGGASLIADRPVRVGDFCRFGDGKVGTVEEIGLRSTRIRSLDRTLVTIPNADFSEIQLENFAARDRMRLFAMLGLRYETTPDQLRHVLAELRKLLVAHPRVTEDPARVRFVGFGAHSLDLEVFAYVNTSDWGEFLKIREDIYLRFMDIVRDSGTGFAFPSQTLYLGRDGGLDPSRTQAAEEQVRAWRESNELPFPDFSADQVAKLDGTADWPPAGSTAHAATEGGA